MGKVAILVLIALVAVISGQDQKDLRLISTSETSQKWLNQTQIEELLAKRVKFMDLTDFQELGKSIRAPVAGDIPDQPYYKDLVNQLIGTLKVDNIATTILALGTFRTRYYNSETGVAAAKYIFDRLNQIKDEFDEDNNVEIELIGHSRFPQPSVRATIYGVEHFHHENVVIGAHLDSVVTPVTGVAPGADDDGSGTSTLIEIFRALLTYGFEPEKTVQFYFYAAEEGGLLGSLDIVTQQANANEVIIGALQLDMTGYSGNNPSQPIGIINDYVDGNLTQFIRILIDAYSTLTWSNSACGYACSDHASWNRAGYRSAFPFETIWGQSNPYVHTGSDTLDKLDQKRLLEFAKIGLSYVVELAGSSFHTDLAH